MNIATIIVVGGEKIRRLQLFAWKKYVHAQKGDFSKHFTV